MQNISAGVTQGIYLHENFFILQKVTLTPFFLHLEDSIKVKINQKILH